eukprot:TRINITY_DN19453_c0_g1_i4.p1 TRINITY_DN19453_c0_g1~~TRINITY_DN19453_c0_g1_i4.p1  ORF type:complete len:526 (-),score=158.84 TRINITY_DN19453_c0_g1_i4:337-1914(-)
MEQSIKETANKQQVREITAKKHEALQAEHEAEQKARDVKDAADEKEAKLQEVATKARVKEASDKQERATKDEAERKKKESQEKAVQAARERDAKTRAREVGLKKAKALKKETADKQLAKEEKRKLVAIQEGRDKAATKLRVQEKQIKKLELEQSSVQAEHKAKATKAELATKSAALKEEQRRSYQQEQELEQAQDRLRRMRDAVQAQANQKAFEKQQFLKASRIEIENKRNAKRERNRKLQASIQKTEQEREAEHDHLSSLSIQQRARMLNLPEHKDHDCPKASVQLVNDTTWTPARGCDCVEKPYCHLRALLEGPDQRAGNSIWCHTHPTASCPHTWSWCHKFQSPATGNQRANSEATLVQASERGMKRVDAEHAANYRIEKIKMDQDRREMQVEHQIQEMKKTESDKAAVDCLDAPAVSVHVINDRRWIPPQGCSCLDQPYCNRKAMLVRGSDTERQGTYMWCYTQQSDSCNTCWAFCSVDQLRKTEHQYVSDPTKKQILPPISGTGRGTWDPDAWPPRVQPS